MQIKLNRQQFKLMLLETWFEKKSRRNEIQQPLSNPSRKREKT